MANATQEWFDAAKQIPKPNDYNKDGHVIVAYEDGSVSKGYEWQGKWAHANLHGAALYWSRYPEHPHPEQIKHPTI